MKRIFQFITVIGSIMILLLLVAFNAGAQTAVIDQDSISYDNDDPKYTDSLNITVDIIFVDAEPITDGVVLKWGLCTEEKCDIPTKTVMTDNMDGSYSAVTGGPFEEKDSLGKPYIDILFTIEVTYTAIGGGEEHLIKSSEEQLFFNRTSAGTDTDSDTDDDTDTDTNVTGKKDSPMGMEVLLIGILLGACIFAFRRTRDRGPA